MRSCGQMMPTQSGMKWACDALMERKVKCGNRQQGHWDQRCCLCYEVGLAGIGL